MIWRGEKIKSLAKERNLTLSYLATQMEVSRQTVNDWINGQIPKGNHLILLCRTLQVSPADLFLPRMEQVFTVPLHRTIRKKKVTPEMQQDALAIIKQYEIFFRNCPDPGVVPLIRVKERDDRASKATARMLRERYASNKDLPLNYADVFKLLSDLGIIVVFRYFPSTLNGYAFYTKISKQRIVFVNYNTNVIDLIFPLLHEMVHALRDEVSIDSSEAAEEEAFCDMVANYMQFPDEYVGLVYDTISGMSPGAKVNRIKEFGRRYSHSLFGIVKRMEDMFPSFSLNVGGADTNFKKGFPSIGSCLFNGDNPEAFVKILSLLSPKFMDIMTDQISSLTNRRLSEILCLESYLDAKSVKDILLKQRGQAN